MPLHHYNTLLSQNAPLSEQDAYEAIAAILASDVAPDQIETFLLALNKKPFSSAVLTGAARAMRANMLAIQAPEQAIDVCGTGGDGLHTLNISSAVAFVVAACGVPVAKHGGRAVSSQSGAADVLTALEVNINLPPQQCQQALAATNLCFLFAPNHHPAMAKVAAIRKKLGVRTIFNLLGPLTNPANVKYQVIGTYALPLLPVLAETLQRLGSLRALVVHGRDGLDEISTTTETDTASLQHGRIDLQVITPKAYSIDYSSAESLKGGDAIYNAGRLLQLLKGERGAYRDIVALNAGTALWVAEKAETIAAGVAEATEALASGAALRTFENYRHFSHKAS